MAEGVWVVFFQGLDAVMCYARGKGGSGATVVLEGLAAMSLRQFALCALI